MSNIYFADKTLSFTDEETAAADLVVELGEGESVSRTKVLNFLENHNRVVVRTPHPERVEALFAREFLPVEAAGGVVVDSAGRWLLI
ncbi:MAG: ADP-ribose pyrophosphatase, partial [Alistipes sp.]|nr:ADP-ribose pyrophosphatase [Alistipes sp.]